MEKIRIQKIIADNGYCSRRKAEELIIEGRVTCDGERVSELGFKCFPDADIKIDGREIKKKKSSFHYLALNKPLGYVSTMSDPQQRKIVKDLIPLEYGRLFPVGRLDQNSSGLLIMTDDGEFANLVTHPSSAPEKEYIVICKNKKRGDEVSLINKGIYIPEEGYTTTPAKAKVIKEMEDSITLSIILHEGKKREIRNMMKTISHPVISLTRIRIGSININDLKRGEFYEIPLEIIDKLKQECLLRKKGRYVSKLEKS